MYEKITYLVKYLRVFYLLYYYIGSTVLKILRVFVRPDDRLILFISFGGKKFDDSPRSIYDEMLKDHRFDGYELVWAFNSPSSYQIPRGRKIKVDTFEYYRTALKARVWITNSSVERGLDFKGKKTFYFDTWHGSPIKLMGTDIDASNTSFHGKGSWDVDIMTAQGTFDVDVFSRVFNISRDRFRVVGLPRNDMYAHFSLERVSFLKKKLGIDEKKKVILYAPTFREYDKTRDLGCKLSVPVDLKKWEREIGMDYVLLFRAHYEVAKSMEIEETDFVREMSAYPHLEDLMIISDLLISDYSSIFFDYSIMHKPMLCFVYDYAEYAQKRGMYFDIRQWLNSADNEDELIQLIREANSEENIQRAIAFQKEYVSAYGDASKLSLDIIAQHLK